MQHLERSHRIALTSLLLLGCIVAPQVLARDVYVIGVGYVYGADYTFCRANVWTSDQLLLNTTTTDQVVRAISVSNGALGTRLDVSVPPRRAISVKRTPASWNPLVPTPHLWMLRLSVPDGVAIESHLLLVETHPCTGQIPERVLGQITLPTFTAPVPANQEQIFLGTDLGVTDRRVNVAVFNAGQASANVEMTVYRSCDGAVLARAQLVVPPNTTVQQGSLHSGVPTESGCPLFSPAGGTYTRVVADQPSIAFVSSLSNEDVTRLTYNFIPPSNP